MLEKRKKRDWILLSEAYSKQWGHTIYRVTGKKITRRSYVLWSCQTHPNGGTHTFVMEDTKLKEFLKDGILTSSEINDLLETYPGEQFYASRMDNYLKEEKPRTECCREKLHNGRSLSGYAIFENLLASRGLHYKTIYTLLIKSADYVGKHAKVMIKCESHNTIFAYSMQNLNYMTSCPCPQCRTDPNHKNGAVDIVKKRNVGRAGQVVRHASKVKNNNTCLVSNSSFDLHHHHLDGQDYYTETQLLWEYNGICLCGTVHRDYHYNFLKNFSKIAKEYITDASAEAEAETDIFILNDNTKMDITNPDFQLAGAEVSRYTFLEYLRFLIFDIQKKNSTYVNTLNEKMALEYTSMTQVNPLPASLSGNLGKITLEQLEITAIKQFCSEYKGENWGLYRRKDIPYANDQRLWAKVEALYANIT